MKNKKLDQEADLVSVAVFGLFGQHNHCITLKGDGLTLVHGPNGVGKTSLLKLIGFAISLNVDQLARVVFDQFSLDFSNGKQLTIDRTTTETVVESETVTDEEIVESKAITTQLIFKWTGGNEKERKLKVNNSPSRDDERSRGGMLRKIRDLRPWLTRVGPDEWVDERTRELLTTDEVLEQQSFGLSRKETEQRERFLEHIPSIPVETIESQRLLVTTVSDRTNSRHRAEKETTNAVQFYAKKMSAKIRQTFHQSANVSQELDRTFAHRVLTSTESLSQRERALRETYQQQLGTWAKIKDAGMLPEFDGPPRGRFFRLPQTQAPEQLSLPDELDATQQRVLSFYVADTEQKLQPYRSLIDRVELFLSIVNSRFAYSGKELRCDASEGFRVQSKAGKKVPLEFLSSGEQHEIVLNFQLIFGVDEKSLVLIDEPEISLHVDWQREFIHQIQRIAEVRGHKFIIATHSPQIIDEHWDSTEVLRGSSEVDYEGDDSI